jgi:hypothetical protein
MENNNPGIFPCFSNGEFMVIPNGETLEVSSWLSCYPRIWSLMIVWSIYRICLFQMFVWTCLNMFELWIYLFIYQIFINIFTPPQMYKILPIRRMRPRKMSMQGMNCRFVRNQVRIPCADRRRDLIWCRRSSDEMKLKAFFFRIEFEW